MEPKFEKVVLNMGLGIDGNDSKIFKSISFFGYLITPDSDIFGEYFLIKLVLLFLFIYCFWMI